MSPAVRAFGPIELICQQGVAEAVFTEAKRGNPIDAAFCDGLNELSVELANMSGLRAILWRAEGSSFGVGGDLKFLSADRAALSSLVLRMTRTLNAAIVRLQGIDAPLIAAVHGACAGGMVGFVAGCDLVIAAENACFVSAYSSIGYSCDAGASTMLVRRMGLGRARRYLLLNETLDSASAQSTGLVDLVVRVDELTARCKAIVEQIAAGPTRAFGEIRRLLGSAGHLPLAEQLEAEAQVLSRVAVTADAREGVAAFLQKRPAVFRGV